MIRKATFLSGKIAERHWLWLSMRLWGGYLLHDSDPAWSGL
jgi:hypothetical protein